MMRLHVTTLTVCVVFLGNAVASVFDSSDQSVRAPVAHIALEKPGLSLFRFLETLTNGSLANATVIHKRRSVDMSKVRHKRAAFDRLPLIPEDIAMTNIGEDVLFERPGRSVLGALYDAPVYGETVAPAVRVQNAASRAMRALNLAGRIATPVSIVLGVGSIADYLVSNYAGKGETDFSELNYSSDPPVVKSMNDTEIKLLFTKYPQVDDMNTTDTSDDVVRPIVWIRAGVDNQLLIDENPVEYTRSCYYDMNTVWGNESMYNTNYAHDVKSCPFAPENRCEPFAGVYNAWKYGLHQLADSNVKAAFTSSSTIDFPMSLYNYILRTGLIPTTVQFTPYTRTIEVATGTKNHTYYSRLQLNDQQFQCLTPIFRNAFMSPDYYITFDPGRQFYSLHDVEYFSVPEDFTSGYTPSMAFRIIPRDELRYVGLKVKALMRFRMRSTTRAYSESPLLFNVYEPTDGECDVYMTTLGSFQTEVLRDEQISATRLVQTLKHSGACLFIDYESSHMRRAVTNMMHDLDDLQRYSEIYSPAAVLAQLLDSSSRFTRYRQGEDFSESRVKSHFHRIAMTMTSFVDGFDPNMEPVKSVDQIIQHLEVVRKHIENYTTNAKLKIIL